MRWRNRFNNKVSCYFKPGPKKVEPIGTENIVDEIKMLHHGRKRTTGTGKLQEKYQACLSRRSIQSATKSVRKEINQKEQENMKRIQWHTPGIVWSVDDTLLIRLEEGRVDLNHITDLGSRYRLQAPPNLGGPMAGELLAEKLDRLCLLYGPPLFLKRDNGSNLNHHVVNNVIDKHYIIPLNSPVAYPPYNGGVEFAQNELKTLIRENLQSKPKSKWEHLDQYIVAALHTLNHKPRKCLAGKYACELFSKRQGGGKYTKRTRKNIFDWIINLTLSIIEPIDKVSTKIIQAAWRKAVETWLQLNGHISVTRNGKVLPCFCAEIYHN